MDRAANADAASQAAVDQTSPHLQVCVRSVIGTSLMWGERLHNAVCAVTSGVASGADRWSKHSRLHVLTSGL